MFGYICVNEQELKLREYNVYRSYYCGLCKELHRRYGRAAQLVLNYDMTFLALLLTGLYEPKTGQTEKRCLVHPLHRHAMAENEAIGYAADMCVLLAYQKGKDDWEDERKTSGKAMELLLKSGYKKVAAEYPRQRKALEESLALLHLAEEKDCMEGNRPIPKENRLDYVSGLTGAFLAELFVWKDDLWQEDLRQIGFYIGKFIYLMDAIEDLEKDRKKGNYNLFQGEPDVWETSQKERLRGVLTGMMTEASRAFERLPIVQHAPILRNILYSGVWCKYMLLSEKQ